MRHYIVSRGRAVQARKLLVYGLSDVSCTDYLPTVSAIENAKCSLARNCLLFLGIRIKQVLLIPSGPVFTVKGSRTDSRPLSCHVYYSDFQPRH